MGNGDRHNLILGVLLVVSEVKTDAIVEEAPVKTDFPRVLALRLQVGALDLIGEFQTVNLLSVDGISAQGITRVDVVRIGVVTYLCPRGAYLCEGNPLGKLVSERLSDDP